VKIWSRIHICIILQKAGFLWYFLNAFYVVMKMNRIREVMRKKGITQKELAEEVSIDQGTLSKIINEKKEITLKTARKISDALGFGIDYLWPN